MGVSPADQHQLLVDHLTAEYRVTTQGWGRTVDEWKLRAAGRDNHWLDCLVGCAVTADMQGCVVGGAESVRRVARKPVKSYSEKYREWKMRIRPAAW